MLMIDDHVVDNVTPAEPGHGNSEIFLISSFGTDICTHQVHRDASCYKYICTSCFFCVRFSVAATVLRILHIQRRTWILSTSLLDRKGPVFSSVVLLSAVFVLGVTDISKNMCAVAMTPGHLV